MLREVFTAGVYDWDEPANPLAFLLNTLTRIVDWFDYMQELHPAVYWIMLGLLTGILIAIVVHVAVLIWRALRPHALTAPPAAPAAIIRRDAEWHLEQWRELRAAGHFAEALTHRFTALILQLDRGNVLTFDPAKTPREYTTDTHLSENQRSMLSELVGTLYRHVFGAMPCSDDELERFDIEASRLGGRIAA